MDGALSWDKSVIELRRTYGLACGGQSAAALMDAASSQQQQPWASWLMTAYIVTLLAFPVDFGPTVGGVVISRRASCYWPRWSSPQSSGERT